MKGYSVGLKFVDPILGVSEVIEIINEEIDLYVILYEKYEYKRIIVIPDELYNYIINEMGDYEGQSHWDTLLKEAQIEDHLKYKILNLEEELNSDLSKEQKTEFHNDEEKSKNNNNKYIPNNINIEMVGKLGEEFVIEHEKNRLNEKRMSNLASQIEHTSKEKGDGFGYDIKSFNADGSDRFIEVKTSRSNKINPIFYLSQKKYSERYPDSYYLYLVSSFDVRTKSGKIEKLKGSISDHFNLTMISAKYKANRN